MSLINDDGSVDWLEWGPFTVKFDEKDTVTEVKYVQTESQASPKIHVIVNKSFAFIDMWSIRLATAKLEPSSYAFSDMFADGVGPKAAEFYTPKNADALKTIVENFNTSLDSKAAETQDTSVHKVGFRADKKAEKRKLNMESARAKLQERAKELQSKRALNIR